jgi:hypothetical protein
MLKGAKMAPFGFLTVGAGWRLQVLKSAILAPFGIIVGLILIRACFKR